MAGATPRGYGEDGIYFDHRGDCRDSAFHKTCSARWRGVVSLGFDAGGKRIRKKVSGKTKTEVKDKLRALHSEFRCRRAERGGLHGREGRDRLAGRGAAGAHGQDGRGEPGLAAAAAGRHRSC